jgi:hypothetical protein
MANVFHLHVEHDLIDAEKRQSKLKIVPISSIKHIGVALLDMRKMLKNSLTVDFPLLAKSALRFQTHCSISSS